MIKLTQFHPSIPKDKTEKYGYAPEFVWVNPYAIIYFAVTEQLTVFESPASPKREVTAVFFDQADPIMVLESPLFIEELLAPGEPIRPALPATPAQRPRT